MNDCARTRVRVVVCCLLALLSWCVVLAPRVVVAQEASQTGTLTVAFQAEGMRFSLFGVGSIGPMANRTDLQLTEPFASYAGDWPGTQDTLDYDGLAQRLANGAAQDGVGSLRQGEIAGGSWAAGEVPYGWYLIVGEPVSFDGYVWHAKPTLVRVPTVVDGVEQAQVTASPKYSKVPEDEKGTEVEHRLVKQWVSDSADVRPKELRITLMHGSEAAETVTLNNENNWTYSWTCKDDGVAWTAVEQDVPDGYEAFVSTEGARVTLKNAYAKARDATEGEDSGGAGGLGATGGTDSSGGSGATGGSGSRGSSSLAITGDPGFLATAAIVVAVIGAAVLAIGWARRSRSRVIVIVGVAALLAAGGLVAQGVRVEATERQARETALNDLMELLPATTVGQVSATAGAKTAAMVVDGRDLVGYLDIGPSHKQLAVHAAADGRGACLDAGAPQTGTATIRNVDVSLDAVHVGDEVSFVDVDGVAYRYVVDTVTGADAHVDQGLVLHVPGLAEGATLVCVPA